MSDEPVPDETVTWQRRFAARANNSAWVLAESTSHSPDEDEEMLQATHTATHFGKIVGDSGDKARAAQLVAHVSALPKLPNPAPTGNLLRALAI